MLFAPKEKAQGLVEYALILVLVAVVVAHRQVQHVGAEAATVGQESGLAGALLCALVQFSENQGFDAHCRPLSAARDDRASTRLR